MIRRVLSGALLAGTLLPLGPVQADVYYETSVPMVAGSVLVPTTTTVSASPLISTSYYDDLLPTSAVVTGSDFGPTTTYLPTSSVVSTYRSSIFRPRRFVERTSYYYAPRSYLTPTSYYLPTTATYVRPTRYVAATSYLDSSLGYLPTSYYLPTTYVAPLARTSYYSDPAVVTTAMAASPCDEAPMPATRSAAPTRTGSIPPPVTTPAERSPSGSIQSTPAAEPAQPPTAEPQLNPTNPATSTRITTPPAPTNLPETNTTPPTTPSGPGPVEVPDPGKIGPKSSTTDEGADPVVRNNYKPIYSTSGRVDSKIGNGSGRNILRGRVLAFGSGKPEEGVTVYLTSRTGAFTDRTTQTDADGHFAVTLPDGDWAVKVRMPSGNVRSVSGEDVTATAGRIMDSGGRGVSEFVITR